MRESVQRVLLTAGLVCLVAGTVYGQGGASSSISGVVKDSAGGVIPGATVVVTSNATQTKFETVSGTTGAFTVPALSAGTYSVSVSLTGFRTVVTTDVRVQVGIPTTINPTLEVGSVAETVTVTGASAELINTQTADRDRDAQRRSARADTDANARRAERRDVSRRREHAGRRPRRYDGERAARVVPEHHAWTASATTTTSTSRPTASSLRSGRGRTPSKRSPSRPRRAAPTSEATARFRSTSSPGRGRTGSAGARTSTTVTRG